MNGRFLRAAARATRRVTSGGALHACALGVHAERSYEVIPGVSLRPTLQIGFAAVTMVNANLGRGRVDLLSGAVDSDPSWAETMIKPGLALHSTSGIYGEGEQQSAQSSAPSRGESTRGGERRCHRWPLDLE